MCYLAHLSVGKVYILKCRKSRALHLEHFNHDQPVDFLQCNQEMILVKFFTAVIEKCPDTGLYVGYVPGFSGAHSQGESLDELNKNLREVIEMLLEEGEPKLHTEFVGTQNVMVL